MPTLTIPAAVSKRKQACRNCRQRKKRCDAERPKCSLCRKIGANCEYSVESKHGQQDNDSSQGPCPAQVVSLFDFDVEQTRSLDLMRQSVPSFNAASPQIGDAGVNVYPSPQSSSTHIEDRLLEFELPSFPVLFELTSLFFDRLYHIFPCFHRQSFLMQVQNGILQKESPLVLFAMCCVTARYHSALTVRERACEWFQQAKFYYDVTQRNPQPALRTIQAALLLIHHAYTTGDFSASWLFLGKAWRQSVVLGINRMDVGNTSDMETRELHKVVDETHYGLAKWQGQNAVENEECRRTLWLMLIMDRGHAWPTGWPFAISETHFKVDIPMADALFQRLSFDTQINPSKNTSFTTNVNRLIADSFGAQAPLNVFHYIAIANILIGRASELVYSLHDSPDSPEYAETLAELDSYLLKFRMSIPPQAISIFEVVPTDRAHVVWLQVLLDTVDILLHYRPPENYAKVSGAPSHLSLAIAAARRTAQLVKDASRISIDLLMSFHLGPSLYVAACVISMEWRLTDDPALKEELDLFVLVFDRMDDVFVFLGLKFKFALEHDMKRSKETVRELRNKGLKGLLTDCSKWTHIKEEVERRGIPIDIS